MIYQYKIHLEKKDSEVLLSSDAYKLYAWLLSKMSEDDAEKLHDTTHILSQFLKYSIWTINIFDEHYNSIVFDIIKKFNKIELKEYNIKILNIEFSSVSFEELLKKGQEIRNKKVEINFLTHTGFKQAGRYVIFPNEELLLHSLIKKWNAVSSDFYFDDNEAYNIMKSELHIVDYNLRTGRYKMKNTAIPSIYGKIYVESRLPISIQNIWNTLLLFSEYSGIGIKTTLGMGGIQINKDYNN